MTHTKDGCGGAVRFNARKRFEHTGLNALFSQAGKRRCPTGEYFRHSFLPHTAVLALTRAAQAPNRGWKLWAPLGSLCVVFALLLLLKRRQLGGTVRLRTVHPRLFGAALFLLKCTSLVGDKGRPTRLLLALVFTESHSSSTARVCCAGIAASVLAVCSPLC